VLIIAINGSPNPKGNTAYMLRAALEEVAGAGAECHFMQVSELIGSA